MNGTGFALWMQQLAVSDTSCKGFGDSAMRALCYSFALVLGKDKSLQIAIFRRVHAIAHGLTSALASKFVSTTAVGNF